MYVNLWAGYINLNNSIFREGISRTFLRFILRTACSTTKYQAIRLVLFLFSKTSGGRIWNPAPRELRPLWKENATIKYREKSRYFFCFRVMLLRIEKVGHRRCTKPDGGLLVERSITTSNASITRRSYGDELENTYCWLFSRPPALFRRSAPYKSCPTRTSSAVKGERNH